MDMQIEDAVPGSTTILIRAHRPNTVSGMQRLQAFQFELRPNGHQEKMARRFAGSSRFVYNRALALQRARQESGGARDREECHGVGIGRRFNQTYAAIFFRIALRRSFPV